MQVVLTQELPAQGLVGLGEMMQIGARVGRAGGTAASRVESLVYVLVHPPAELEVAP